MNIPPMVHAGAGDALFIHDTLLDLSCNNDQQPIFFLKGIFGRRDLVSLDTLGKGKLPSFIRSYRSTV